MSQTLIFVVSENKVLTIYVAPEQFYSSSLRITDLITTIRNNNINISAGYLEEKKKRFVLRIPGELKIVDENIQPSVK